MEDQNIILIAILLLSLAALIALVGIKMHKSSQKKLGKKDSCDFFADFSDDEE